MKILKRKFEHSALMLAQASRGNPAITTATVILFMCMFNLLEALVEKLIFGERFEHWLDPIFTAVFICYAVCCVWACAVINARGEP